MPRLPPVRLAPAWAECSRRGRCRAARTALHTALPAVLLAALALAGIAASAAAQPLSTGATHRGVVVTGPYQIFPENRAGNGVYLDGVLQVSVPGQTILGVAAIAPGGRLLYVARGADGKRVVGSAIAPGDTAPRISEPAKGYQYVVAGFEGQGYKKFFRVTDTNVTDLLPSSRTADGLTFGPKGILFYHVGTTATGAPTAPDGPPAGSYGIRLHWLNLETGAVKHLGRPIYNGMPAIKLGWSDDGRVQYTLKDGTTGSLSTADFK